MSSYASQALTEIPDVLTPEDRKRLLSRGTFEQTVPLYQEMIDRYQHPYLLVKLADIFATLNAGTLAIDLFRKAQNMLSAMGIVDSELNFVIDDYGSSVDKQVETALALSQQSSYYQKWKPTKEHIFPTNLPQLPVGAQEIKDRWNRLISLGSKTFDAYVTNLAIETNHIERTFLLTQSSAEDLIRRGVSEGLVESLPRGALDLEDPPTIKKILDDTISACRLTLEAAKIDRDTICRVHATLMKTCQFLWRCYIAGGRTRTETRKTVIVSGTYNIECCPFPTVDAELEYICKMSAQWIKTWRNPFATASWIHLVLVRCHPFEDGNGRLVRLLASIPLLQHGYPPISIALKHQAEYYHAINKAYDGDHTFLVQCILNGMNDGIAEVESLVKME